MLPYAGNILRPIALILVLALPSAAQEGPRIHLTAVSPPDRWTDEQTMVLTALGSAFEAKQADITSSVPEWTVVIDAITLDADRYIVSFVLLQGLPEPIVDLARKNEVFYLNATKEQKAAFTSQGKGIREMLSEELVRQFGSPVDSHISIVRMNELAIYAGKFADDFFERYVNKGP